MRERMTRRLMMLAAIVSVSGAGAIGAACSSSTPHEGFTPLGDGDGGGGKDGTVDAPVVIARDGQAPIDSGLADGSTPSDGGGPPIKGACSPVNGPECDIVLQNCAPASGQPRQCVSVTLGDGGPSTQCRATNAAQHLPKGHSCCPTAAQDPCLPGLTCIGANDDTCATDAALTGRCSPACCDDNVCGKSDPEGFAGRCELHIVSDKSAELYTVCAYNQQCKQFHVQACPQGFTCILDDNVGTSSCVSIFNPDGGPGIAEGQPCSSANGCADGMMCLSAGDGGSTCSFLCFTPGATPPAGYDAGALQDGAPGYGGCPSNERCNTRFDPSQAPAWIQVCAPP